jgi:hypothetical protein
MEPRGQGLLHVALNKLTEYISIQHQLASAPVANEVTIRVILILAVMAEFDMQLIDVRGAFLNRRFQNGEKVYYTTGCNGIYYRINKEQSIFLSVLQMDPRRTWVLVIMG